MLAILGEIHFLAILQKEDCVLRVDILGVMELCVTPIAVLFHTFGSMEIF